MKNTCIFGLFFWMLASCIHDCDHCEGISNSIKESKRKDVFVRRVKLDKRFLITPDLKDTFYFKQAFIEHAFEYDPDNNYEIKKSKDEYRIILITNKSPNPFGVKYRIGDLDSYYFMGFRNGLECPIYEESINEELRFQIYEHKIIGNKSEWKQYDSLNISLLIEGECTYNRAIKQK